jgi:hypothetical protein
MEVDPLGNEFWDPSLVSSSKSALLAPSFFPSASIFVNYQRRGRQASKRDRLKVDVLASCV